MVGYGVLCGRAVYCLVYCGRAVYCVVGRCMAVYGAVGRCTVCTRVGCVLFGMVVLYVVGRTAVYCVVGWCTVW